ncbi:MAG: hypothetical protein COB67_09750 [SAR324 cluster bacterium]|uniref:HTH araC/xylS-type domain-containing protein n=1 Tax=SAR324 cluster bacterium TaxID=2024889 RepID=A0A2A4T0G9_9DELT|nr:MAG: hypothetical protein COB67_09750 [SAR324 cluster bacterium]
MPPVDEPRLDYLGFQSVAPSPRLAPYVQCYWIIRRAVPLRQRRVEYLYPDGGMGIIFNLGGKLFFDGQQQKASSFLDGTSTQAIRFGMQGQVHAIGIRFLPGGAYPFMPIPVHELNNSINSLQDIRLHDSSRIYDQLCQAVTVPQQVMAIENWLLSILSNTSDLNKFIRSTVQTVQASKGQISVTSIAEAVNIGKRQLERIFKKEVGLAPKNFTRILRVKGARTLLKNIKSCADVGHLSGFYDQPHFIREFKRVNGFTPMTYQVQGHLSPLEKKSSDP